MERCRSAGFGWPPGPGRARP